MSAVRRRKASAQAPTSESDTDGGQYSDAPVDSNSPTDAAPTPLTHTKGENKGGKMAKRLKFGSLLLVFLCCIIAAGHLWTLFLVCRA